MRVVPLWARTIWLTNGELARYEYVAELVPLVRKRRFFLAQFYKYAAPTELEMFLQRDTINMALLTELAAADHAIFYPEG
jgi:hypothetical protein